jgi:Tol biopolymer transport system component
LRALSSKRAAWLPTGERVSVLGRLSDGNWRLVTVPVHGGSAVTSRIAPDVLTKFKTDPMDVAGIVWSASADFLYFSARAHSVVNLWRVSTDPETLEWTGGPERVTTGAGDDQDPALSADGSRVAFTVARTLTRIWSVPFDSATGRLTGDPVPLTPGEPGEYDAAVPPDGTRLVYRTVRGSRQELWERSVGDGSHRLLLASREWAPTSPRWSRDGTRLAFTRRGQSVGSGDARVFILSPTTGMEYAIATPGFVDVVPDDWTADGRWILASCRPGAGDHRETCLLPTSRDRSADIKVIASDATRDLIFQRFSPDGRWISFIAQDPDDLRTSTLYTMPAAGGPWTAVTSGTSFENNSRWAPDGRTLYFVSNREGFRNVWGRRFDALRGVPSGEPFKVTHFDSPTRRLAVNRDGNFEMSIATDRLFLPVTETGGDIWLLERLVP